ncbi:M48 family metallopeptidase [Ostreibacterium oceani]|uniref:M48 family metalloprotease n=1 Tax=Ostreibacterium oceani TaxID=2654998 RepID=A0A6N7EX37_9GAMM|nr:M48 family metallopeptidase [Ostreibacterium oceani]MPV86100.1 M48 family metalloprotease [Ostreibacterium oceani]
MHYEDPILTKNVNVSKTHPLVTAAKLLSALVILLAIAIGLIWLFANQLVQYVPFAVEKRLTHTATQTALTPFVTTDYPNKTKSLQGIADKIRQSALRQNPDHPLRDFSFTLHYSTSPDINAFATLGGHIVINQGLIDVMDSENMLAMVIAHEMAHIMHRDVLRALSRSVLTGMIWAAVFDTNARGIDSASINLLQLNYSRDDEKSADKAGIALLNHTYGNAYGGVELFELFSVVQPSKSAWVEISSSHPLPVNRINALRQQIQAQALTTDKNSRTALPAVLKNNN